jgi:dienelactone hydrolase
MSAEMKFMQLPPSIQNLMINSALKISPLFFMQRAPHIRMLLDFFSILGADRGEMRESIKGIRRLEYWGDAWSSTAKKVQEEAEASLESGHDVTAGEEFFRACLYHTMADRLQFDEEAKRSGYKEILFCHGRFLELLPQYAGDVERVVIPTDGGDVYGLLRLPAGVEKPPCVIMMQGGDTVKEQLFHWESIFVERGMATMNIDQPGNGETRLKGNALDSPSKLAETARAIVDYLEGREKIDSRAIGIHGFSWGGFVAPYMAASEVRIKACSILSAIYRYPWEEPGRLPAFYKQLFSYAVDAGDDIDLESRIARITMQGMAEKIQCPLLIIHGERDGIVPVEMARRLAREVGGDVELVVVEGEDHACTGILDTKILPRFGDWMKDRLEVYK